MHILGNYVRLVAATKRRQNSSYSPSELTNFVRKVLKNHNFKFKTRRSIAVDTNTIQVGGIYDPYEDQDGYSSIEVTLYYNPDQKNMRFSDFDCATLFVDIVETLRHEYCHQEQYRKREWELPEPYCSKHADLALREEENYLGLPDEVESYGVSIAVQIFLKNKFSVPRAVKKEINNEVMYQMYQNVFGKKHTVVDQVRNFAVQYLDHFKGCYNVEKSNQC